MHESIFGKAFRSFLGSLFGVLGFAIGIALTFMAIGALSSSSNYLPPPSEMTLAPDAQGNRELLSPSSPAILRLDIHGVIGMGDLTTEKVQSLLLDSRDSLLKGDRVKAILLHINTPGGTVDDADGIYRSLVAYKTKYKVPIYAYVEGLCASGGMYVASSADKIFATSSSVIGSVGVIMGPTFNLVEALSKLGISALTLTEGKDKDSLNPFRTWGPNEAATIQAILAGLYDHFVSIVSEARPKLSKNLLINTYGARVYLSEVAAQLGYIDQANSDYATALRELSAAASIEPDTSYQVVLLQPSHPFLSSLTDSMASIGKTSLSSQLPPLYSPELSGKALFLYTP